MMFYGPLKECPVCGGTVEYDGQTFTCCGSYSEWSTCIYNTRDPPRLEEPIKFPDFVQESAISAVIRHLLSFIFTYYIYRTSYLIFFFNFVTVATETSRPENPTEEGVKAHR